MKIGIIVAMDKELRQLQSLFTDGQVKVIKCGIGKVNAALGAQQLINEFHPDCIISSGCAGGNGDDVHMKDIVVSTFLAYHDVPYLLEKALQLKDLPSLGNHEGTLPSPSGGVGVGVVPGLIVTGDWFVDSKEKMREIVGHFPEAKAVDMESCAIAHTCYLNRVPFISFRVVSDIPLRDDHASQYHDFWDTVSANSFLATKSLVESL